MPILLISGSRAGIGRGIAEHFAGLGWTVHGCSRQEAGWGSVGYHHAIVDVTKYRDVQAWVRRVDRESGGVDVAIANAALVPTPRPAALGVDDGFTQVLATNIGGAAALMSAAAGLMIRRRHGRILAMSSIAPVTIQPGTAWYSASKAGLEAFVKVLAVELGNSGVTCNAIAPSVFDSPGLQSIGGSGRAAASQSLVVPRLLELSEITTAIEYFISPQAGAVTGQVLRFGLP